MRDPNPVASVFSHLTRIGGRTGPFAWTPVDYRLWVLESEFQDVLFGKRDDRPAFQALLGEVRRPRTEGRLVTVVVFRLDQLGRRILERVRCREELKALGVLVHRGREGGEVSDLVTNILVSVAEEESRALGERVAAAK